MNPVDAPGLDAVTYIPGRMFYHKPWTAFKASCPAKRMPGVWRLTELNDVELIIYQNLFQNEDV